MVTFEFRNTDAAVDQPPLVTRSACAQIQDKLFALSAGDTPVDGMVFHSKVLDRLRVQAEQWVPAPTGGPQHIFGVEFKTSQHMPEDKVMLLKGEEIVGMVTLKAD